MEWHPMFCTVYISLIIVTAGFVLTVCSWLAPPLTAFVDNVRILGLVGLVVGSFALSMLCLIAGLNQGKCCRVCYKCNESKEVSFGLSELIGNPLLNVTAIIASNANEDISDDDVIENDFNTVNIFNENTKHKDKKLKFNTDNESNLSKGFNIRVTHKTTTQPNEKMCNTNYANILDKPQNNRYSLNAIHSNDLILPDSFQTRRSSSLIDNGCTVSYLNEDITELIPKTPEMIRSGLYELEEAKNNTEVKSFENVIQSEYEQRKFCNSNTTLNWSAKGKSRYLALSQEDPDSISCDVLLSEAIL